MKPFETVPALLLLSLCCSAQAGTWEIKSNLEYTDGARSDVTRYESNGDFDQRKIKQKREKELDTRLLYLLPTANDELSWQLRLGRQLERKHKTNLQLREDGSIKKDKTRTEYQRTSYAGAALLWKPSGGLGADRWQLSGRYDRYLHVDYAAGGLHEDAKDRDGSGEGYELKLRAKGEYSTPWLSLYLHPYLSYKQEYLFGWHDRAEDEAQAAEQEQEYAAGLLLSWLPPLAGWELIGGALWQRELDAERAPGSSDWVWEDEERVVARLRAEYEAPLPGFELELDIERHLSGVDEGETQYRIELSYEF